MIDGLLTNNEIEQCLEVYYSKDISRKIYVTVKYLKDYIIEHNLKGYVIGLSGGIDSTLIALLANLAIKEIELEREKKCTLYGYSLPCLNSNNEIKNANLCKSLVHEFVEYNIKSMYESTINELCNESNKLRHNNGVLHYSDVNNGNVQARLRMLLLYDMARVHNCAVLSTDNLTELLTGFWTLHGDVGDVSPLQFFFKTDVYNMAKELASGNIKRYNITSDQINALNEAIKITPTDGLGISSSDVEQLGCKDYNEVDNLFVLFFNEVLIKKYSNDNQRTLVCFSNYDYPEVIKRYINTSFKRNNPHTLSINKLYNEFGRKF